MKKHNFYAGPSILPEYTIQKTGKAIENYDDTGLSILEISHRSPQFEATMQESRDLFRELLQIPEGYQVLFLGGGASTQFFHIPYNFLNTKAAYLDTGAWSTKAIKEAKLFGETVVVASSADKNFSYIPQGYNVPEDADYFHITTNNTVRGTEILEDYDIPIPLIADMSSDILSRPLDVSKYMMIYGGAQKNLAPAGVTFVIVKEDALGKEQRPLPTMVDYRTHIKKDSSFNTPPVVCIYAALQTLKWIKASGGVEVMEKQAITKSNMLYDEIERNKFFKDVAEESSRSRMNITFVMRSEYADLEKDFLTYTVEQGLVGLKGHRSVGGFRASNYNALPEASMKVLVEAMQAFEKAH